MTRDILEIAPLQIIAGIGPYNVGHPYRRGALQCLVILDGVPTVLTPNQFAVTPESSDTGGIVTLTEATAAAHAGGRLEIRRRTDLEQGWTGQTAREKGVEAQLDWMVEAIQEVQVPGGSADLLYQSAQNAARAELDAGRAEAAAVEIGNVVSQLPLHPLSGSLAMTYDPGNMSAHPGGKFYDPVEARVWRVYSEAEAHAPKFGMVVYAEYSDGGGSDWKGKRAVWPGEPGRKVLHCNGQEVDGRFIVIVNTEDAAGQRYLDMIYSDDIGASWSKASIANPSDTIEPFMFGALHKRPALAGGGTGGAVFYCYTNGSAYAFFTSNKGVTWSSAVIMSPATVVTNSAGAEISGIIWGETTVDRVADDKFIAYFRPIDRENFFCATSTDMLNWNAIRDSGITNEGPELEVGSPPHLIAYNGEMTLYYCGRENWTDHTLSREQDLLFHNMNALALYEAGGVFDNLTPFNGGKLPTRAVGMMAHTVTPSGVLAFLRAGETVFANNQHAATSQLYQMSSYALPSNPIIYRENQADNSDLALWARGTVFTGITVNGTPTAERMQLYPSTSDTMTASREAVPIEISNSLPHRPKYGMRVTSTGGQFSGVQQAKIGTTELSRFADTEVTVTVFGVGVLPSVVRVVSSFNYGTGGSASEEISNSVSRGVESATGLTCVSGTVRMPTLIDKTIGSNPRAIIRLDQFSSDAWNFLFCGFKIEFGNGATVLRPVDPSVEQAKALRYFRPLPAVHTVVRDTDTRSLIPFSHPPMAQRPVLGGRDYATGFSIRSGSIAGAPGSARFEPITNLSIENQEDTGGRILATHASILSGGVFEYDVGTTYRAVSSASLHLDAE